MKKREAETPVGNFQPSKRSPGPTSNLKAKGIILETLEAWTVRRSEATVMNGSRDPSLILRALY